MLFNLSNGDLPLLKDALLFSVSDSKRWHHGYAEASEGGKYGPCPSACDPCSIVCVDEASMDLSTADTHVPSLFPNHHSILYHRNYSIPWLS
jgi:hypothetical protein